MTMYCMLSIHYLNTSSLGLNERFFPRPQILPWTAFQPFSRLPIWSVILRNRQNEISSGIQQHYFFQWFLILYPAWKINQYRLFREEIKTEMF